MNPTPIVISGTGIYHPSDLISNQELVSSYNAYIDSYRNQHEKEIEQGLMPNLDYSTVAFIEKASGIKQRYVIDKKGILDQTRMRPKIDKRPNDHISLHAEMAVQSIQRALIKAQVAVQDIDAVIVACSNMQRPYPAIAIEVQNALGAKGFAFDMNVACSSATFGITMAYQLIQGKQAKTVVVVSPEICSAHLDYSERESHFIFGDASAAVIIQSHELAKASNLWEIKSCKLETSFSNNIRNNQGFLNRCEWEGSFQEAHTFSQQGRKVFKEVIPLAYEHILAHCEQNNLNSDSIKRYWLHQANHHMNELIAKKLLGREPSFDDAPTILDQYANTAAAGCLIAFDHHQKGLLAGEFGIICSFGAGYSIGSLLVQKL